MSYSVEERKKALEQAVSVMNNHPETFQKGNIIEIMEMVSDSYDNEFFEKYNMENLLNENELNNELEQEAFRKLLQHSTYVINDSSHVDIKKLADPDFINDNWDNEKESVTWGFNDERDTTKDVPVFQKGDSEETGIKKLLEAEDVMLTSYRENYWRNRENYSDEEKFEKLLEISDASEMLYNLMSKDTSNEDIFEKTNDLLEENFGFVTERKDTEELPARYKLKLMEYNHTLDMADNLYGNIEMPMLTFDEIKNDEVLMSYDVAKQIAYYEKENGCLTDSAHVSLDWSLNEEGEYRIDYLKNDEVELQNYIDPYHPVNGEMDFNEINYFNSDIAKDDNICADDIIRTRDRLNKIADMMQSVYDGVINANTEDLSRNEEVDFLNYYENLGSTYDAIVKDAVERDLLENVIGAQQFDTYFHTKEPLTLSTDDIKSSVLYQNDNFRKQIQEFEEFCEFEPEYLQIKGYPIDTISLENSFVAEKIYHGAEMANSNSREWSINFVTGEVEKHNYRTDDVHTEDKYKQVLSAGEEGPSIYIDDIPKAIQKQDPELTNLIIAYGREEDIDKIMELSPDEEMKKQIAMVGLDKHREQLKEDMSKELHDAVSLGNIKKFDVKNFDIKAEQDIFKYLKEENEKIQDFIKTYGKDEENKYEQKLSEYISDLDFHLKRTKSDRDMNMSVSDKEKFMEAYGNLLKNASEYLNEKAENLPATEKSKIITTENGYIEQRTVTPTELYNDPLLNNNMIKKQLAMYQKQCGPVWDDSDLNVTIKRTGAFEAEIVDMSAKDYEVFFECSQEYVSEDNRCEQCKLNFKDFFNEMTLSEMENIDEYYGPEDKLKKAWYVGQCIDDIVMEIDFQNRWDDPLEKRDAEILMKYQSKIYEEAIDIVEKTENCSFEKDSFISYANEYGLKNYENNREDRDDFERDDDFER